MGSFLYFYLYYDYLMKEFTQYINERSSRHILSKNDKPKIFNFIRNKFNDDDFFLKELCKALIDTGTFDNIAYNIAENNNINISNI